jgi:RNase P/RNase MRP subunit p29
MNIVGKNARIISANDKTKNGLEGKIVYETANTIIFETQRERKMVEKRGTRLLINGEMVDGESILGRIERRIVKN